jgi:hypothetical protein
VLLPPAVLLIVESRDYAPYALFALVGLLTVMAVYFQLGKRDLFMLAAGAGAAMTWVTFFLARLLFEAHLDLGAVFLLGVFVIGEVGAAAFWLRTLSRRWRGGEG